MGELLNSPSLVDKILKNNSLNKCQPKLFVRSDEEIVHSGQITWTIQFPELLEIKSSGVCKMSPNIKIGSKCTHNINITVYPLGKTEENKSFLSIFICFNRVLPKCAWVQGDISFVDEGRQSLLVQKFSKNGNNLKEIGFLDFVKNSEVHNYVRNDKLIIFCRMKVQSAKYKCTSGSVEYNVDNSKEIYDYKEMIGKSAKFADLAVIVDSKRIDAHKCILASEVPALRPLLNVEDSDNIELKDISYSEFKDMVNYLYSGNIQILNFHHACALYITAIKYEVHSLRDICIGIIVCNLTERNVLIAQILADEFKDDILEKECIKFIKNK